MNMKKVMAVLLAVSLTASLGVTAMAADFTDTQGHWAEEHIDRWQEVGVLNGDSETTFNPDGEMTRAEAAQVFTNLLKLEADEAVEGYTDLAEGAWYINAISACVDQGIMNGVGEGLMDPNGTVTREMFFVMFGRALGLQEEKSLNKTFADSASVSSWAQGYVYALINHGYVNGVSDSSIAPQLNIDRASVAALLDQTIVA